MNKFKVGDKVRVYGHVAIAGKYSGYYRKAEATVIDIIDTSEIYVKFRYGELEAEVHPHQCRRAGFKKGKARRQEKIKIPAQGGLDKARSRLKDLRKQEPSPETTRLREENVIMKIALQSLVDYQFASNDRTGKLVLQHCEDALKALDLDA